MTTTTLNKVKKTKILRYGHTPDPDDAYMFYGFASGQVRIHDFEIEHVLEDIESLNQKAVNSDIEVTAISAAIYPQISHNYWILPVGASVGRNYGPVVATLDGQTPKGKKLAFPGFTPRLIFFFNCTQKGMSRFRTDLMPSPRP